MNAADIEACGEYAERDVVRAAWLGFMPQRGRRLVTLAVLGLSSLVIVVTLGTVFPLPTALVVGLSAALPFILRREWRRSYRRDSHCAGVYRCSLDDTGFAWDAPHESIRLEWSHFLAWRESATLFVLYNRSKRLCWIFPKRWFAGERAVDGARALFRSLPLRMFD